MKIAHYIVGRCFVVLVFVSVIYHLFQNYDTALKSFTCPPDNLWCTFCLSEHIFTCEDKWTSEYFECCNVIL